MQCFEFYHLFVSRFGLKLHYWCCYYCCWIHFFINSRPVRPYTFIGPRFISRVSLQLFTFGVCFVYSCYYVRFLLAYNSLSSGFECSFNCLSSKTPCWSLCRQVRDCYHVKLRSLVQKGSPSAVNVVLVLLVVVIRLSTNSLRLSILHRSEWNFT